MFGISNFESFFLTYIFNYFYYLDCIGLALPLIIIFFNKNRVSLAFKKSFSLFYLLYFLASLLATILYDVFDKSNTWVYNVIPILIIVPLYIFFRKVPQTPIGYAVSKIAFVCFIGVYIFTFPQLTKKFLSPTYYLLLAFYIMFNSVSYLIKEIVTMREGVILRKQEFWFVISIFYYASACVIVWSAFSYLERNNIPNIRVNPSVLWVICHNTVLFIQCLVFSIMLVLIPNQK
jgi:hypothetical protein